MIIEILNFIHFQFHKVTSNTILENNECKFDNITKSPNDERDYRGLILENELKVLLISDSKTEKSAAALGVQVGKFLNFI